MECLHCKTALRHEPHVVRAHAGRAAVLHMDGIGRQRLDDKRFGVFECAPGSDHPLTADAPQTLRMPHSRWNDLPEDGLVAAGYRVPMRSEAGVDAFVKQPKASSCSSRATRNTKPTRCCSNIGETSSAS